MFAPLPAIPPDLLSQAVGVVLITLWLALLALGVLFLRRLGLEQGEWSRKLVHIGSGAVVPLAWACAIDRTLAVAAAAAITVLAWWNHRRRLLPAIEDVGRDSYGTVAYGGAITLLLILWWPQRADAVCAGVLVMALGDGLAGLVGAGWPSPSWRVLGQRRSLLGTATMLLVSLAAMLLLAALLPDGPTPTMLLGISVAAMLLEQLGWGGLDNLTVPLAVAWLWQRLSV